LYIGPTIKNLIELPRSIEPPRSIGNSRLNMSILNSYENLRFNERPVVDPISRSDFINEENTSYFNSTAQGMQGATMTLNSTAQGMQGATTTLNSTAQGMQGATTTLNSTVQGMTTSTTHEEPNNFRKDLLKSLRRKYNINEYDNINIRLDNLERVDLLLYWIMDASTEDILKNPIIVLNDE